MGAAAVSYRFHRPPSTFRYYPRAVFGRRAALVPAGGSVPRLEASVDSIAANGGHVARYRQVCGFGDDGLLPIAYPHVLAMPLHIAMLTHPRFPVRLMGLIHVTNEIHHVRPMAADGEWRARTWIEGHRDGDRGHEFDVFTEFDDSQGAVWHEKSTLLARRAVTGGQAARSARQTLRYEKAGAGETTASAAIDVERRVGRRYGWLSGDLNPIHLGDRGAKLFGFDRAVAHGMWSMARSLAALGAAALVPPVRVHVDFKLPLFLPAKTLLEHWTRENRRLFVLKDADSGRPHLAGCAQSG